GIFGNKYILKNSTLVCSCQNNGSCPLPANLYLYKTFETFGIYDLNRIKNVFFNQSCLNILLLSYNNTLNISILNQSLSSRFLSTTKIEKLEEKYSSTLTCPCTQISIPYRDSITIEVKYHQICTSDFVIKKYVNYLFYEEYWYGYKRRDIRVRSSAYFLFFSNLYQISQITINNATEEFLNQIFINTKLISEFKFNIQIENIILQIKNVTLKKFIEA
ncbi:unnamed protein product, partial [Adineta steineri]